MTETKTVTRALRWYWLKDRETDTQYTHSANIQTDSEGAAVDFDRAAAALRPQGRQEAKVTPRGSSQSNGVVERMNQTVAAMCRGYKVFAGGEYRKKN